jgi:hypothetical protein
MFLLIGPAVVVTLGDLGGSEWEAVGEGEHEVVHGALPAEGAGAAGASAGDGAIAVDVAALDVADAEVEKLDGGIIAGEVPGTMYRFKGLEYRCLIIAGVAEGLVPRASVDAWERTDPSRHQLPDRSLSGQQTGT